MASALEHDTPIGALLADVNRLRGVLGQVRTAQIQSSEVKAHIRAVASAWFTTYRVSTAGQDVISLDDIFTYLRTASERSPSTQKVRGQLRQARDQIIELQTLLITSPPPPVVDVAPPFGAVPDPLMKQVLKKRWDECVACLQAGAPLAATVMMGGLLESLFLARVNRETHLAPIFTARSAPRDKAGRTWPLKDWGLGDYIAVAHELGWITQSGKDVSAILQNYRNYIHPQKELSSAASLSSDDAKMFWAVFKTIALRLL